MSSSGANFSSDDSKNIQQQPTPAAKKTKPLPVVPNSALASPPPVAPNSALASPPPVVPNSALAPPPPAVVKFHKTTPSITLAPTHAVAPNSALATPAPINANGLLIPDGSAFLSPPPAPVIIPSSALGTVPPAPFSNVSADAAKSPPAKRKIDFDGKAAANGNSNGTHQAPKTASKEKTQAAIKGLEKNVKEIADDVEKLGEQLSELKTATSELTSAMAEDAKLNDELKNNLTTVIAQQTTEIKIVTDAQTEKLRSAEAQLAELKTTTEGLTSTVAEETKLNLRFRDNLKALVTQQTQFESQLNKALRDLAEKSSPEKKGLEDTVSTEVPNPAVSVFIHKLGEIQRTAKRNSDEERWLTELSQLITQENLKRHERIQQSLRDLFPRLLKSQNAEQKRKTLAFTIDYYEALDRYYDQDDYNNLKSAYEKEVRTIPTPESWATEEEKEAYQEKIKPIQEKHRQYFRLVNTNLVVMCARNVVVTAEPKANATDAEKKLLEQLTETTIIGLVDPFNKENIKACKDIYDGAETVREAIRNDVRYASGLFYLSLILTTVVTASAAVMFFGPILAGIAFTTFQQALVATQATLAIVGVSLTANCFFAVKKAAPTESFLTAVSKAYSTPQQYEKAVPLFRTANNAYHVTRKQSELHEPEQARKNSNRH